MKTTVKNWKTTVLGVLTLLGAAGKVATFAEAHGWAIALQFAAKDPETIALVTAGVGLIVAQDGKR